MKYYKEDLPLNTLHKIRTILHSLGLILQENHISNGTFYSCRVSIANHGLQKLNIGTNGKGRSFEFSAASGYAEFMERIQNHVLFNNVKKVGHRKFVSQLPPDSSYRDKIVRENLILDFFFDSKEEMWDLDKILKECSCALMDLLCLSTQEELENFIKNEKQTTLLMLPFYSVFDKKVKHLPIDYILKVAGTNGMCAGNTPSEALLQGFGEIFERYVLGEIYFKHLTPPTIPFDAFQDTIVYDRLIKLKEEYGYDVTIKDCSLGREIPALGLLIVDKENRLYNFKLGVDFTPEIALERCMTEIYQGSLSFKGLPMQFFDKDEIRLDDNVGEDPEYYNFNRIFIDSSGQWPISIFSDKNSYEFKGFSPSYGNSTQEDLKLAIGLIKKLGFKDIFIRNTSFLGFPTYHIVVPGMSQYIRKSTHFGTYKKSFPDLSLLRSLPSVTDDEMRMLAKALAENYEIMKYFEFNYTDVYLPNINEDLLELDIELLAFMVFYYLEDFNQAYVFMNKFLLNKDPAQYVYYYIISDYVKFKHIRQHSDEFVKSVLYKIYHPQEVDEVFADLAVPRNIFQYHEFPDCYNCDNCKVSKDCTLFEVLKIEKKLRDKIIEASIHQLDMKDDLYFIYQ